MSRNNPTDKFKELEDKIPERYNEWLDEKMHDNQIKRLYQQKREKLSKHLRRKR